MSRLIAVRMLVALMLATPMARAQTTSPASASNRDSATAAASDGIPRPANDSIFRRARRLVSEGNGVAGRALVDSLLAAADPSTSAYGDALYWHGAIAPTAAAAEHDYRRVIVEYPLAYYSGDALLAIAELEQARGDRVGAMQHLQRFVREHPESPGRGIAALGVARLAFEQQDSTLACAMLVVARRSTAASDVELRNQIAYFGNRCASVPASATTTAAATTPAPTTATTSAPQVASVPTPVSAPVARREPAVTPPVATPRPARPVATRVPETAPAREAAKPPARDAAKRTAREAARMPARDAARKKATPRAPAKRATPAPRTAPRTASRTATRYTVQVAAYGTRTEADALVKRLAARGVKARVSGSSKPFRVRLGLHASRKDAAAEAASLRKRGIDGFVAEEDVHVGARTP